MGKIRVKSFGDQEEEKKQERKLKLRKEAKEAKKLGVTASPSEEAVPSAENLPVNEVSSPQESTTGEAKSPSSGKKKQVKKDKKAFHSQKYDKLAEAVDKTKVYSLNEGLELLEKLQRKSFDETVELHLNTVSTGITGNVVLPNGTGKKTRVAIADDKLIASIEKGIIDFDILVATPAMMPLLGKVARVLGPKGLMPNPKNGTITEKPEEVAKKYEGGQFNFKTEAKSPLMHLTVGKISFGPKKLSENVESLIAAVKKQNIKDATLKSTMSPAIKLKI